MPSDMINDDISGVKRCEDRSGDALPSTEGNKRQRTSEGNPGKKTMVERAAMAIAESMATNKEHLAASAADPLNVSLWSPRAKYLISKMRLLRFIDEDTPTNVLIWLARSADKLFIYAGYGKTGDATTLLRRIRIGHAGIDQVLASEYADLTSNGNEREDKEVYWTFASAFLICFYEVKAKKPFCVQYYHPKKLVTQFIKLYPEFSDQDSMQVSRLLTYHLCMQVAVSAFGGANPTSLVELVTRMTEGREIALNLNKPAGSTGFTFTMPGAGSVDNCRHVIFQKVCDVKKSNYNAKMGAEDKKVEKSVRFAEQLEDVSEHKDTGCDGGSATAPERILIDENGGLVVV